MASTPESTARPLDPEAVYPAPPAGDGGDDKLVSVPFHTVLALRLVVFALSLAAFVLAVVEPSGDAGLVFLGIALMFGTLRNALYAARVAAARCWGRGGGLRPPRLVLIVGDVRLALGRDSGYRPLGGEDGGGGGGGAGRPGALLLLFKRYVGVAADLFVALMLLIISLCVKDDEWTYSWRFLHNVIPLNFTIVALCLALILMTPFRVFHGVSITVRPDDRAAPGQYRIRLPRDDPEASHGAKHKVSVQAAAV